MVHGGRRGNLPTSCKLTKEENPRCPRVAFSKEEMSYFFKPWSKALSVSVFEKTYYFLAIKRRLESLWAVTGAIQVTDMSNYCYVVQFESKTGYLKAAYGEPFKIFDYYITMSFWTSDFDVHLPLRRLLTWILLPDIHLHYFSEKAVTRIVAYVGKPILSGRGDL
ncbi:unnamed protein product [Cuscuta epithymum]|uniref:DUF4283 domain-containing protein n=1 Tax=Cuscuta epithymum TaxID=186058 RepID=A0AAV0EQW9_9ASTE|nr:unnamed protein product [Cuscuta epithymum]